MHRSGLSRNKCRCDELDWLYNMPQVTHQIISLYFCSSNYLYNLVLIIPLTTPSVHLVLCPCTTWQTREGRKAYSWVIWLSPSISCLFPKPGVGPSPAATPSCSHQGCLVHPDLHIDTAQQVMLSRHQTPATETRPWNRKRTCGYPQNKHALRYIAIREDNVLPASRQFV